MRNSDQALLIENVCNEFIFYLSQPFKAVIRVVTDSEYIYQLMCFSIRKLAIHNAN